MQIDRFIKPAFTVIGREGSTEEGPGFVQRLWQEANARYGEIAHLTLKDADGRPAGLWGAMTDPTRAFLPWADDFTRGLYLAGAECPPDAQPPEGWARWTIPGFEYLRVLCDSDTVFRDTLACMAREGLPLVGAVHDYTCPTTGASYMCFPIRAL